jgi:hypothetical protein
MPILKRLLNSLGLPGRAAGTAKDGDHRLLDTPKPIDLSPAQQALIETRIAEFISDSSSVHAHAFAAIARVHALPLYFEWTAFMALRRDGQIVWVPYDDEPGDVEIVREERLRNLGLFQGTRLHRELYFLLPRRPPGAFDCPECRGTGKVFAVGMSQNLADKLICSCGGIGWLPHGEKP